MHCIIWCDLVVRLTMCKVTLFLAKNEQLMLVLKKTIGILLKQPLFLVFWVLQTKRL
jgi:hypothetical protein